MTIEIRAASRLRAAEQSEGLKKQILEWKADIARMKAEKESATETRQKQLEADIERLNDLISQKSGS
jgi:hypothetical protein